MGRWEGYEVGCWVRVGGEGVGCWVRVGGKRMGVGVLGEGGRG